MAKFDQLMAALADENEMSNLVARLAQTSKPPPPVNVEELAQQSAQMQQMQAMQQAQTPQPAAEQPAQPAPTEAKPNEAVPEKPGPMGALPGLPGQPDKPAARAPSGGKFGERIKVRNPNVGPQLDETQKTALLANILGINPGVRNGG